MRGGRVANYDVLRLCLALEVLAIHCIRIPVMREFPLPLPPVPAFVALSGFLIPDSWSSSDGWRHFARKRLLRVLPAFVLSLVLVQGLFGAGALVATLASYVTLGLVQRVGSSATHNGALWSLALEELLYTSHVLVRLARLWRPSTAVALYAATMVAWFFVRHQDDARIFESASTYFAANVAWFHKERLLRLPTALLVVAFVVFVAISTSADMSHLRYLATLGPLCVTTVLLAAKLPQVRFPMPDVSYGIYVFHVPILIWLVYYRHLTSMTPKSAATLVLTLALATASWYALEKRALRYKNPRSRPAEA
jgi:peptidoglycan/LPS O-acetylase OafA/YrhL